MKLENEFCKSGDLGGKWVDMMKVLEASMVHLRELVDLVKAQTAREEEKEQDFGVAEEKGNNN